MTRSSSKSKDKSQGLLAKVEKKLLFDAKVKKSAHSDPKQKVAAVSLGARKKIGKMSRKGKSIVQDVVQLQVDNEGIPVEPRRTNLVRAISNEVTHCDNFNPCISWPKHKKEGRVEELWIFFKDKWKLPDNPRSKKWFNETANARWKDFKSRVLKPIFDNAPDLATAKARRPDGVISVPVWEELCDQFAAMSDPGSDGKSKSAKCRDARKIISVDHHWGRTSISGWSYKHLKKFGKGPSMATKFKKGYMRVDPLEQPESSTSEGDATQEQQQECVNAELCHISEDLQRVYDECIRDGSDESTANTIACQRVLGKNKGLGIDSSKTKRVARSRMSYVQDDELQALKEELHLTKQQLLSTKEELQNKDDKVDKLERTLESVMAHFRLQGHVFPEVPDHINPNDDEGSVG